jgi:outer membrane protein assembly factor BamD
MKFRAYIILIISLLVSSCGEYGKLLKSTDFELKKEKAKEYYQEGQYVKASELLSQVLTRYRATEEAEELNWINAQCSYRMNDYIMAGTYFKTFSELYPYGRNTEEANFMVAMCDYNMSPRAELDQSNTLNAIDEFTLFINRFPVSDRLEEANQYIKVLQERLVEKSYLSAKLYSDMSQYKAAVTALDNSLKEYPETKYREEMMYLKLNSLFLYAENSVIEKQKERYQTALDEYYSFKEEFPGSIYDKEVAKIYEQTGKYLNIDVSTVENN